LLELKCGRVMAMKAVKMWKGMSIGRSWRTWMMMVVERKRLKALFSRVVLRWKLGTLSNSFVKWWLELSRMRITERTMAKILRRTLCKAWGRWEDKVDFFGKKEVDFVGEKEFVQACSCNTGACPQCGRILNQVVDGNGELDPDLQSAEGAFVGLEVTEEPPHHVKKIDDLVDKNFVRWDALGYSNPPIHILDRILQVHLCVCVCCVLCVCVRFVCVRACACVRVCVCARECVHTLASRRALR